MQKIKIASLLLVLVMLSTGCSLNPWQKKASTNNQNNQVGKKMSTSTDILAKIKEQSKISKFTTLKELQDFLAKGSSSGSYGTFGSGGGVMMKGLARDSAQAVNSLSAPMPTSVQSEKVDAGSDQNVKPNDFSKTNTQVAGVDEADIIKTDGKYIYAVVNSTLLIIDGYPAADAKIISKIELKDQPQDLYLNGDKLAVFGQSYGIDVITEGDAAITSSSSSKAKGLVGKMIAPDSTPVRQSDFTYFKVYDISDKQNPKIVRDLAFEGNYFDSRMIGDYVYFVSSKYSYDFGGPSPLPMMLRSGKLATNTSMPPVYYFNIPYDSYNFTTVSAINIKDDTLPENSQVYLLNGSQNMYVSEKNIYISYTKYLDENQLMMQTAKELLLAKLSLDDQALILKIDQVDSAVLSDQEKIAKVFQVISRYLSSLSSSDQQKFQDLLTSTVKQKFQDIAKELEKTIIHKIAINNDQLEYKGEGEVTGQLLSQYSMDEKDGFLRIATTKNQTWSRFVDDDQTKSYNNLYVLDENLKPVGSLENLANGEKLYSARFMGDRAYLVTFQQTDPLFVIDLKTPEAPKVLGELKMPGFSNYLHPYDENTLIGIGKDTMENSYGGVITGGLKLALFDVSQVDKPIELDNYVIGDRGSDSMALSDPKAFLFSKDKNLLVIPASLTKSTKKEEYGQFSFSGALVFKVDGKKIELRGKIDHSDGGQVGNQDYYYGSSFYNNAVRRSLFINEDLYTMSNHYIKINSLSNLSEVNKIILSNPQETNQPMFKNSPEPALLE